MTLPVKFVITTAQVGPESYVVSMTGEVDMYHAPELERDLREIAARDGKTVVVDLGGVSFIDSTVLGVLTREAKRLRNGGGDLLLVSDDPRILRAFEITGLDRIFRIERTLTQAVALTR